MEAPALVDVPPRSALAAREAAPRRAALGDAPGVRDTPDGRLAALDGFAGALVPVPSVTGPTDGPLPLSARAYARLRALKGVTGGLP